MTSIIAENEFGQIKQVSLTEQISMLEITHDTGTAKISLYGGQVLEWQPVNEQPVFWLSENAIFEQGTAIRGGIPLCWPWFGPYQAPSGETAGNHGFARQRNWQLDEVTIEKNSVTVTMFLSGLNDHPLWPHQYQLKQQLIFSKQFEQRLFISNLSSKAFEYSAALHSYFAVSAPENIKVPPLSAFPFDDKVTGKEQQLAALENCSGEVDRIYYSNEVCSIEDKQWQRTIKVSSTNCQQWVLWNPGAELANKMKDLHVGAENEFVCLEAANTNVHVVEANETVMIGQTVSLA
ncbi:D-hexose-6-phosphate mutarotase [Colwellia sp. Bg11-12]|uniref:D-hexose-6-phosphate mutarotase n=1 Tax=Colwellia sp. Bg11-12 TaxID=2759817 RepID=UPI0015F3FF94|nr:D-hexose-6-phosphate mutarotase [Colwellia sp. Bg11-12]MBA6264772.1 D-hexose-6-phosphate mutarotase [Colwellia sp. Bg11-12]